MAVEAQYVSPSNSSQETIQAVATCIRKHGVVEELCVVAGDFNRTPDTLNVPFEDNFNLDLEVTLARRLHNGNHDLFYQRHTWPQSTVSEPLKRLLAASPTIEPSLWQMRNNKTKTFKINALHFK